MATIQINALNPAGSDLFADNESYLKELTDSEMAIEGGNTAVIISFSCVLIYLMMRQY